MTIRSIRRLYRLHKWNGVIAAPVLLVICVTGAISVFRQDLQTMAVPYGVAPLKGLGFLVPGAGIQGIQFPVGEGRAATLFLSLGQQFVQVAIDPGTGAHIGPVGPEPTLELIRRIHTRLTLNGLAGRVAVGLFGISMLISCLTGWLIHGRFVRGKRFWRLRHGRQLATSDLHKLIGISSLAFNLLVAVTGTVLALETLAGHTTARPRSVPAAPPPYITPDQAMEKARAALPALRPRLLLLPDERSPRYALYADITGALTRSSASFVLIHAVSGDVLQVFDASKGSAFFRLSQIIEPLHYGSFGGLPLKIAYATFGLAGAALSISGALLFLMKRRHKRKRLLA